MLKVPGWNTGGRPWDLCSGWPGWCLKARPGWTCALAERSVSGAGVQPRVGPRDLKGALPGQGRVPFFYEFFSMHRGCLNGSDMPTSLAYIILLASGPSRLLLVLLRGALSSLKKSIGGAAVPKRPEQQ